MKELALIVAIICGVATILYFRVDVGMSWVEMAKWIDDLKSQTLIPLLVLMFSTFALAKIVPAALEFIRRRRAEKERQ